MADIVDIAHEQAERVEAAQIAAVRANAQVREVQPTGECLFCEDQFDEPPGEYKRLYCDALCSRKHARRLQLERER
jgi:hypothetical protein